METDLRCRCHLMMPVTKNQLFGELWTHDKISLGGKGLKLSYLFSDGMVLQRGKRNYIWGETSPEIIVTGILDGRKFNTKADTHGMFVAELPDLPVGGPYCMEINGDEKRVIRNIMSGDVFLLGGQSNMEL